MEIPEYIVLTDDKMKVFVAESAKQLAEEQFRMGIEPYTGTVEGFDYDGGADLSALDAYNEEFKGMIEDMFEKLPNETKILEGSMEMPIYTPDENELSNTRLTEEQWKTLSLTGSSTSVHIPTLTSVFGNSSCTAEPSVQNSLTLNSSGSSCLSSMNSCCGGRSDECGCETATLPELSDYTAKATSGHKPGTPSEEK
jgi:hypothetical protein